MHVCHCKTPCKGMKIWQIATQLRQVPTMADCCTPLQSLLLPPPPLFHQFPSLCSAKRTFHSADPGTCLTPCIFMDGTKIVKCIAYSAFFRCVRRHFWHIFCTHFPHFRWAPLPFFLEPCCNIAVSGLTTTHSIARLLLFCL